MASFAGFTSIVVITLVSSCGASVTDKAGAVNPNNAFLSRISPAEHQVMRFLRRNDEDELADSDDDERYISGGDAAKNSNAAK